MSIKLYRFLGRYILEQEATASLGEDTEAAAVTEAAAAYVMAL